ncbi:MAG TPA: hypothetical protein DD706_16265 [Nitrospiraceae bacterium]|nr:hypothetical protein [Nitrospiraceae bacterium]
MNPPARYTSTTIKVHKSEEPALKALLKMDVEDFRAFIVINHQGKEVYAHW